MVVAAFEVGAIVVVGAVVRVGLAVCGPEVMATGGMLRDPEGGWIGVVGTACSGAGEAAIDGPSVG